MTLESDVTNMIPATKLKEHKNVYVYVDGSASAVDKDVLDKYF